MICTHSVVQKLFVWSCVLTNLFFILSPQAHCHYVVVKLFAAKLSEIGDTAVHSVLSTLALLYTLHGVAQNSGDFLQVIFHIVYKTHLVYTFCSTQRIHML